MLSDITQLQVLHVEDDAVDARLLEKILGNIYHYDFQLIQVVSLEQALKALAETNIDIVFLDISLPDATGLESIHRLHEVAPQAPVVILSGAQNPEITLKAVEQGAQDYLVKGQINEALIVRTVRYALDRKRMEVKLEYLSKYDPLSGLANRWLFYDRLNQAIVRSERRKQRIALLFVDLDFFKTVNDEYGHAVGDQLLQQVAVRLQDNVRREDTIARIGGDEFAIILEGVQSREAVAAVAEKLLASLDRPYILEGHKISITASIGIMPYDGDGGMTPEALLNSSDLAMYRAKKRGRNHYYFVESGDSLAPMKSDSFESRLVGALDRGEFFLVYQPQIDIRRRTVAGAEALLRWNHPELGIICPSSFLPLLEMQEEMHRVGEWILYNACRQWAQWREARVIPGDAVLSVNLSVKQFRREGLAVMVAEQLRKTGLSAPQLMLEITEKVLVHNTDANIRTLKDLKYLGVGLAVDNFGIGFSTLNYLKHFPVDCLKLDRAFVADILENKIDKVIAVSIIRLAKDLNLRVVAEGVDSAEKAKVLQRYGCRVFQGYYYAAPLSIESFPGDISRM